MTVTQTLPATSLQCDLVAGSMNSKVKDAIEVKGPSGESLKITFQRTIRVPDNSHHSDLPPGMGKLPLYSVADHKNNMPADMALKGVSSCQCIVSASVIDTMALSDTDRTRGDVDPLRIK